MENLDPQPARAQLGPFALGPRLGVGGTAVVYRGVHTAQGTPVAIKVMQGERAREAEFARAFRDEVQAVARLHHPGVAMVFDHGVVDARAAAASDGALIAGSPYLVLECLDGGTLRERRGRQRWSDLRGVLLTLLDALAHAHARGVVHRDLKPVNVLFGSTLPDREGPKLTDFGLAHAFQEGQRPGRSGTPRYMAPEQFRGAWRDYGPWTDLYALGCVAWELCTGSPPFRGESVEALAQAHLTAEPPDLAPARPTPDGFEAWLLRLLEKDPSQRFQRAADAAHALSALDEVQDDLEDDAIVAPPPALGAFPTLTLSGTLLGSAHHAARPAAPAPLAHTPAPPVPASWRRVDPPGPSPRLIGAGLALYGLRAVPLVDRDAERDAIWDALRAVARTGRPRALALRGASGVGKTRLVQWCVERAHEVGAASAWIAVHSPRRGGADGLTRALARDLHAVGLDRAGARARVRAVLTRLGARDTWEHEALASWLGEGSVSFRDRDERFEILRRHLARRAAARPQLLWIDDAQWGEEAVAFARRVLARPETGPVLILLTVQEEALAEHPAATAALDALLATPHAAALDVGPLHPEAHLELVEALVGLSGDLAREVARRTAGNPLFAVQLVGDWVERGLLEPGPGGFHLRRGEGTPLPDDLHRVWADRVDRAVAGDAAARGALEIAAALGQEVDGDEWARACAVAGVRADPSLVEGLVARRLAFRVDGGWAFAHGMLRESVERAAAEAGAWPARNAACAAILAHRPERAAAHHVAAGSVDDAVDALTEAARRRSAEGDAPGALRALDRRDGLLRGRAAPDDPRWGTGWVLRADVLSRLGRLGDAEAEVRRAIEHGAARGWPAVPHAWRALGHVLRRRGQLQAADEAFAHAEAGLRALGLGSGAAARGRAWVALLAGELDAAEAHLARARDAFSRADDARGLADCDRTEGDIARLRRDWDRATLAFERARAAHEALGDRRGASENLHGLAEIKRLRGDLAAAEADYRETIRIEAALGDAAHFAPRYNLALCQLARGDLAGARAALDALLELAHAQGAEADALFVQAARLAVAAAQGDEPVAREALASLRAGLPDAALADVDLLDLSAAAAASAPWPDLAAAADAIAQAQRAALGLPG